MVQAKEFLVAVDLDGTLVDTEEAHFNSYREALLQLADKDLTREIFNTEFFGHSWKHFLPKFLGESDDALVTEIHDLKKSLYSKHLSLVKLNEGLYRLLSQLSPTHHMALCTTASKATCDDIMAHFKMDGFFEYVLTGEDVENPKPDPEGYTKCMSHFKISPENTIIFEDSKMGIEAGERAGAHVFSVCNWCGEN